MRIAVAGSSGLLGTALVSALEARGDEVVRLVRRPVRDLGERTWAPQARRIAGVGLADVDAVVNLAGAPIAGGRWSKKYRDEILSSRVGAAATIVNALERAQDDSTDPIRCRTFLSASAVGIYGYDCGDRILTEASPSGTGFLAGVCAAWEGEARKAQALGTRVALLRSANVLSANGGFLGAMRPLFKAGLAGRIGDGRQWLSWIHIEDHVAAMCFLLDQEIAGPVNLSSPRPVRNEKFTKEYARTLSRPAVVPFPRRLAGLGLTATMVEETIDAGQRVVPEVLKNNGFKFKYPSLARALRNIEGKRKKSTEA